MIVFWIPYIRQTVRPNTTSRGQRTRNTEGLERQYAERVQPACRASKAYILFDRVGRRPSYSVILHISLYAPELCLG
jgi:hypothetical protein